MRFLIVLLLAVCAWAAPTIQTVCASGCTTANLQTAINTAAAANSGPQIIVLTAGENFDTSGGFTLPARSGSYTGWITLRSSRISELPGKTRVAPADVAKMATIRLTSGAYNTPMYTTGHPSAYWRLEGLEFTLSTTGLNNYGRLIELGTGYQDQTALEPSQVSHHFVIDRCYFHGIAFDNGPRDGILVNADNVEILNSYISEIKRDNDESHALLAYSLHGPLLVRNTFHGGAAIGSLVGGAGSASATIQPNNLQFLGNHYQGTPTHRALRYAGDPQGTSLPGTGAAAQSYWKTDTSEFYMRDSWASGWYKIATGITGNVCVDGDFWENTTGPTYFTCTGGVWVSAGGNRTITGGTYGTFTHFWSKNRFELKKATGALVEGNLIENCFSPTDQSQGCGAFLFNWVTDQDGPWATIREINATNNLIRRVVNLTNEGTIGSSRIAYFTHRNPRAISLNNNLVQDGNNPGVVTGLNKVTLYYSPPLSSWFGGTGILGHSYGRLTHNTLINPLASTNFFPYGLVFSEGTTVGWTVSDNIFETGNTSYTFTWNGNPGCDALDDQWTSGSFKKNVVVQLGESVAAATPARYDTSDCQTWAFPWKRSGTGVRNAPDSASITGGVLTIDFGAAEGAGHGLLQGTKIKLAGWTPAGLNTTYTVPRLWCSSGSTLTAQYYQRTLCLPTAETGAVTPGTIEASVSYTDYSALNFRLAGTSVYKSWATDGSDPGANQDVVEWATAAASSGADNPYLDFRVRAIVPTDDGATFRYTAYSTAACTWRASSTRAFSDDLGSWGSETRIGRDGAITVTGLSSDTSYWFRVTCDSRIRDGQFVTTH